MKHSLKQMIPLVVLAAGLATAQPVPRGIESEVMKADEVFRLANLHRDTESLDRILAPEFYGTNQNGNSRNKAEMIDLFASFPIATLTTDTAQVGMQGGTATVTGTQTEDGTERMLFTRVYVNGRSGWQLLASMQFRNRNQTQSSDTDLR